MDELDKLITRLNATKTAAAMGAAKGVKKAALLVQGDAKRLVPVDTGHHPLHLLFRGAGADALLARRGGDGPLRGDFPALFGPPQAVRRYL